MLNNTSAQVTIKFVLDSIPTVVHVILQFFFNQWVVDSMLLDELKKIILFLPVRDSLKIIHATINYNGLLRIGKQHSVNHVLEVIIC